MDIRLALNEATSTGTTSATASTHQHHHHHSFFHHHGSISIHMNNNNNINTFNNNQTTVHNQSAQHSHIHNIISGSASSAFNAIMGHHHHHGNSVATGSTNASYPTSTVINIGNTSSTGTTISSGSQSAGVLGSISFGLPSASATAGAEPMPQQNLPHSPTPPLQRRLAKSFSVAPNLTQQKGAILRFQLFPFLFIFIVYVYLFLYVLLNLLFNKNIMFAYDLYELITLICYLFL